MRKLIRKWKWAHIFLNQDFFFLFFVFVDGRNNDYPVSLPPPNRHPKLDDLCQGKRLFSDLYFFIVCYCRPYFLLLLLLLPVI